MAAERLRQSDENPFRPADVAEPIRVLVLHHFADELRSLAESGERVVEVAHGEHGAQIAECVHRRVAVVGDDGRGEETREFEPAVAVGRDHHGDLDALVAQAGDATGPFAFDRGSPFERQAEFGEEGDGVVEGFHHDADVVHAQQLASSHDSGPVGRGRRPIVAETRAGVRGTKPVIFSQATD